MNEYISKETAVDAGYLSDWYISSVSDEPPVWTDAHIDELLNDFIVIPKDTPAADVHPVNQWVSTKDRLPDEDGWYLVCKHNRVRVAEWCKDCWYNESDLPIDDCAITHWQLLPKPPKDGDK